MITSVTQCKGENSAEGVSTAERFSSSAFMLTGRDLFLEIEISHMRRSLVHILA
jgi:hypothetical protein